jgi:hypothetical protein
VHLAMTVCQLHCLSCFVFSGSNYIGLPPSIKNVGACSLVNRAFMQVEFEFTWSYFVLF